MKFWIIFKVILRGSQKSFQRKNDEKDEEHSRAQDSDVFYVLFSS